MTIQDIKRAIEFCTELELPCEECPYDNVRNCSDTLKLDARKLIIEQERKIKRLKKETGDIRKGAAKEILQTLYNKCYEINDETGESMGNFVSDDDILCLAKHYGVEVVV